MALSPHGHTQSAFSLVELSIVLVILGLLTGGILAGQSLIRAAELRATANQFATYRAAAYSFRDKYFAWPGDMTNATAFWQSAGGTGSDAACFSAQSGAAIATCNGDGNGQIYTSGGAYYTERFSSWKHLANAGLIEGSYTGKTAGAMGSYVATPGTNLPAARIANAYFDLSYYDPNPALWFPGSKVNTNAFGINSVAGSGILKPEEAWNIDTKFDDGSPVYGNYYTAIRSWLPCVTSDANTATYDFTQTATNCILVSVL